MQCLIGRCAACTRGFDGTLIPPACTSAESMPASHPSSNDLSVRSSRVLSQYDSSDCAFSHVVTIPRLHIFAANEHWMGVGAAKALASERLRSLSLQVYPRFGIWFARRNSSCSRLYRQDCNGYSKRYAADLKCHLVQCRCPTVQCRYSSQNPTLLPYS